MSEDYGKATIDLLYATKAIVERDLGLGLITQERLRFTIEARKEEVKRLADEGLSTREIAAATGVSQSTVQRDLNQNGSDSEPEWFSEEGEEEAVEEAEVSSVEIKEVLTKVASGLYDEQNCKARLFKLQLKVGQQLLELRELVESAGEDWWQWYGKRNLRPKREAERLMADAQREMEK